MTGVAWLLGSISFAAFYAISAPLPVGTILVSVKDTAYDFGATVRFEQASLFRPVPSYVG